MRPLKSHSPHKKSPYARSALIAAFALAFSACAACAADTVPPALEAGTAKIDITDLKARPVNDRLFAKALVIKSSRTALVIVTVDAVAIGEIGPIGNDFLPYLRSRIKQTLGIPPSNVLVTASHCHGSVCSAVKQRTFKAVLEAFHSTVPVKIGAGRGYEDRIMINRRLKLKDGSQADVRHAYSLPPDQEVAGVGPVDPEIGILRLDREDGRTLAVVYNFACHPIQGVPGGANTADIVGFASRVIEENLSEGTTALFLQGCAGDINPVYYKQVHHPRSAEPLGIMLGLSALKAIRKIKCRRDPRLKVTTRKLHLPRADLSRRIKDLEAKRFKLLLSLKDTSLNLKTFLQLIVKYKLSPRYPSYYPDQYLHDKKSGRLDLYKLDEENRRHIQHYIRNIYTMEEITRINTNLELLRKHQSRYVASGGKPIEVEVMGVRIGDFVLLTFPGEPSVQVGLNIKKRSPHPFTFVAGYTNGYIYYAPTAEQLKNPGCAQEDCDCLLAPQWQEIFESAAAEMLKKL